MSCRYSSLEIRRLQGAVHWSMLANRQGRNHCQRGSPCFDIQAAGAELEDPLQHLDRSTQRAGVGERTVQLDPLVSRLARDFDPRKILAGGDHQVGKRLVVLLFLVVLGLHILDQPRFHQQRVDLALTLDVVGVADLVHPVRRPLLLRRLFEEIAAGARAQILGLAHVDHTTGRVLQQVDARRLGEFTDLGRHPPKAVGRLRVGRRVG